MGDYITNRTQLVFPNGNLFRIYLDNDISEAEKDTALDLIITESEKWVNNMMQGLTAIPATHIRTELKQVALEYARYLILRDNYIFEKNDREPVSGLYLTNAKELIANLRYPASASTPAAAAQNTGNGTITAVIVDSEYTLTESWVVRAVNDHIWEVIGSVSGVLFDYDTDDGYYPVQDEEDRYYGPMRRISFRITPGTTPFVGTDEFTFNTYKASWKGVPAYSLSLSR